MTKILLADDDVAFRESLAMSLENEGYSVTQAVDGRDALKKLEEDNSFELVILDIIMPEMDGIEFISKVRKMDKPIKTIAISGGGRYGGQETYLRMTKALGAKAVIEKPFTTKQILSLIKEVL
ncbi:MAG: response regulator [Lentisphaerota bacterium]